MKGAVQGLATTTASTPVKKLPAESASVGEAAAGIHQAAAKIHQPGQ